MQNATGKSDKYVPIKRKTMVKAVVALLGNETGSRDDNYGSVGNRTDKDNL